MLLKVITKNNVLFATILFFDHGFKFQDSICNGCIGLTILCLNLREIAIIAVKDTDHCCAIHAISKSVTIGLSEISVLDDCKYI